MAEIVPLSENYLDALINGFGHDIARYVRYMQDVQRDERFVLLALDDETQCVLGYITLLWHSEYPPFAHSGTPEIADFIVCKDRRGTGIGKQLLSAVQDEAVRRGKKHIGLGVGLGKDYGVAQRLYGSYGFIPDGSGIWSHGKQVRDTDTVILSPRCVLMMVKAL